ncbi:MAG: methyltransferase [Euryarchaeota archaeon]|nr:methyltransferase [Euryarchaeota archaeon]
MTTEPEPTTTATESHDELLGDAYKLVSGLWSGRLIYTAVTLGIVDALDDTPTAAGRLAEELELDAEATYRLLRTLAHYGVLTEDDDRRFTLTPVGEVFEPDHPQSMRAYLRCLHSPEWVSAMFHLPEIVEEGQPGGFTREFGTDIFEYIDANPEFGETFNDFMTAETRRQTEGILAALADAVDGLSHLCAVGGGHGYLLSRLLDAHDHLDGTVLERPSVVDATADHWAPKLGVDDRCQYVAGDMFESVPTADGYLLKWVLHDWSDEECVEILSTIHDAAPADGRLFVIEAIVPGPDRPGFAKRLDMTMLVHMDGRERTDAEYRSLLEKAGWEVVNRRETDSDMSVLEATKA